MSKDLFRLVHHDPTEAQKLAITNIKLKAMELAHLLEEAKQFYQPTPSSAPTSEILRGLATSITKLQECVHWATYGIMARE